jgi:hypothetical protein
MLISHHWEGFIKFYILETYFLYCRKPKALTKKESNPKKESPENKLQHKMRRVNLKLTNSKKLKFNNKKFQLKTKIKNRKNRKKCQADLRSR